MRFVPAPGGRGTEVHVKLRYAVPGGKLGETVARYFGEDPRQQLDDDLRRFKQVAETGEVVRSEGAPGGKRARREFPQHPARPLSDDETRPGGAGHEGQLLDRPEHTSRFRTSRTQSILNRRDAIVKITSTAICGSDLHLLDGYVPTMQKGDIMGHEFMGEVIEVGRRRRPRQAAGRRPGRGPVPDRLRCVRRLPGRAVLAAARTPTRTRGWPRSSSATRRPASSATRI